MSKLAAAVVAVLEAQKRIDFPTRPSVTFFSQSDQWLYVAVLDGRTCDICRSYENINIFYGNWLRRIFPYLEVIDEEMIKVNVHPNCRCFLMRYIGEPE